MTKTSTANITHSSDFTPVGFGDKDFTIAVYIANKPNMVEYQNLFEVLPLVSGEIDLINQACGNGWRKVFNVYAKFLFALDKPIFDFTIKQDAWQAYRDKQLLQNKQKVALLFSPPLLRSNKRQLHIITGKGHAKNLIKQGKLVDNLLWLDDEFAIDKEHNLVVCPYFDYRQLSNNKIIRLIAIINRLAEGS
jgi:hypothetical protein